MTKLRALSRVARNYSKWSKSARQRCESVMWCCVRKENIGHGSGNLMLPCWADVAISIRCLRSLTLVCYTNRHSKWNFSELPRAQWYISKQFSLWFQLASLHALHVRWSCRGSRAFGTNFPFMSVFVFSEKNFMVQGEDKLKGSAQANIERNRQRFERKKKDRFRSGGEHSRTGGEHSPVRTHTSTRSRFWAWRNHKTLTNL